ncbi:MAG: thioredoxin [Bacilli bacterium]|nr:thioredoxin [Bacilli bacterium]
MSVVILSDVNFKENIQDKEVALIDFYASWCGPCKMLSPILEEISKENPNIFIGKVNIDFEREVTKLYNVWTIPTLIVFKKGLEVNRNVGFLPKDKILELVR